MNTLFDVGLNAPSKIQKCRDGVLLVEDLTDRQQSGTLVHSTDWVTLSESESVLCGFVNTFSNSVHVELKGLVDEEGVSRNVMLTLPTWSVMDVGAVKMSKGLKVKVSVADAVIVKWMCSNFEHHKI